MFRRMRIWILRLAWQRKLKNKICFMGECVRQSPFLSKDIYSIKKNSIKSYCIKGCAIKREENICGRLCNGRQRVKEWNPEKFLREQAIKKKNRGDKQRENTEVENVQEEEDEINLTLRQNCEEDLLLSPSLAIKTVEDSSGTLNPLRRESLSEEERLYQRCKERSFYLLTGAAKTERRLREKLQKSEHYTEEIIERTLSFLKEYDYINDYRYCMQYLEENAHRRSAKDMQSKLYGRGVDGAVIREALEDFQRKHREQGEENSFEEQGETDPERIALRRWLEKKSRNMDLSDWKERQKLTASLLRKGFSYSMIQEYLQQEE